MISMRAIGYLPTPVMRYSRAVKCSARASISLVEDLEVGAQRGTAGGEGAHQLFQSPGLVLQLGIELVELIEDRLVHLDRIEETRIAVVGVEHPVFDRAQLAVVGVDQREQLEVTRSGDIEHEVLELATGGLQPFGHVDALQLVGLATKLLLLVTPVAGDVLGRPLEPVLALLDPCADTATCLLP